MLASILSTLMLLPLVIATAIPSSFQHSPSRVDERQVDFECKDYGAVTSASSLPQSVSLLLKQTDGTCCGSKPYVNYQWTVTEKHIIVRGACKFMHVVNGAWPPPPIVVTQGTIIRLEVINRLASDPITLHAHGLDQKASQWMDGPESVVQRGIMPGKRFTYKYDTSVELPGTYWIHNHMAGQYPKGLRAPLVILDKDRLKEAANWKQKDGNAIWDENMDNVLSLSDWFSQDWGKWEDLYENGKCGKGVEVPPLDFLVNDLRADKDNTQTYNFRTSKTNPKSGRIRLINMSALTTFYVYMAPIRADFISDIKLKVIEADGVLTDGAKPSQIVEVAPGQRLSVLIDPDGWAASQPNPNTYRMVITVNPYEWRHTQIKAKTPGSGVDAKCYEGPNDVDYLKTKLPIHFVNIEMGEANKPFGPALTFYEKYKVLEDAVNKLYRACFLGVNNGDCSNDAAYDISTNFADFDDVNLKPLVSGTVTMPTSQEARFLIQTWEDQAATRRANLRVIHWNQTNSLTNNDHYDFFAPQDVPAMEQVRQGKNTYADFTPWKHVMIVPDNESSYIVALYSRTGTHPIHLHGHKFRVLYRERQKAAFETSKITLVDRLNKTFSFDAGSKTLQDIDNTPIPIPSSPLQRDTITLYKFGLVVLQIDADNPGTWFLHCHNDFHARTGMASMVVEKPNAFKARLDGIHALNGQEVTDYRKLVNGNGFDSA